MDLTNNIRKELLGPILLQEAKLKTLTESALDKRISELNFIPKEDFINLLSLKSNSDSDVNTSNNHLIIHGEKIHKLSGLVSFSILKPIKEGLPVIFQLGDIHYTIEGQCSECVCNTTNCCLHTFNPYFLSLLDSYTTTNSQMDIYVEDFDLLSRLDDRNKNKVNILENKYMSFQQLQMYKHYYNICFLQDYKKDRSICPTSNTRWQFGDSRKAGGSIEYYCFFTLMRLEDPYWGQKFGSYISLITSFLTLDEDSLKRAIDLLLKDHKSLIRKQIMKSNINMQDAKNIIYLYIRYIYEQPVEQQNNKTIQITTKILNLIKNELYIPYHLINKKLLLDENIMAVWVHLTSWFLDLYIYFRFRKQQFLYKNSILSLFVLGHKHCIHLNYLLTSITKEYENLYIQDNYDTKKQCIEFDKMISIDELLNKNNFKYKRFQRYNSKEDIIRSFQKLILGNTLYDSIVYKTDISELNQQLIKRCNEIKIHINFTPESMKQLCMVERLIKQSLLTNQIKKDLPITISYEYSSSLALAISVLFKKQDIIKNLLPYSEVTEHIFNESLNLISQTGDTEIFELLLPHYSFLINHTYFEQAEETQNPVFLQLIEQYNLRSRLY